MIHAHTGIGQEIAVKMIRTAEAEGIDPEIDEDREIEILRKTIDEEAGIEIPKISEMIRAIELEEDEMDLQARGEKEGGMIAGNDLKRFKIMWLRAR